MQHLLVPLVTKSNSGIEMCHRCYIFTLSDNHCVQVSTQLQRSAKVFVRGLVKFVPALAYLAGTNFTKPRTKTLANLCTTTNQISACCQQINLALLGTDSPPSCRVSSSFACGCNKSRVLPAQVVPLSTNGCRNWRYFDWKYRDEI